MKKTNCFGCEKKPYGKLNEKAKALLLFDLYWLRYKKPGDQWYELTDYLRECLRRDGIDVGYDDKNKDVIFEGHWSVRIDYLGEKYDKKQKKFKLHDCNGGKFIV